jgi:hypothetical protein
MRRLTKLFVQNLDGFILRENFLISSIVTIFIIRIFLKLTDYPQLSGAAGLHIAHLLWGGFFMALSLLLLLSFVGRGIMGAGAILGGIGFGAFIDELGKFITQDNNYFFQPTVALVYVIFILIYSLSKSLEKSSTITSKEYLVNALGMVTEAVMNDLDNEEKKKALLYLKKSDQSDPLVKALKVFFAEVQAIPVPPPSLINRLRHFILMLYTKLTQSKLLNKLVVTILLLQSLSSILSVGLVYYTKQSLSFVQSGELAASLLSGVCVLVGVVVMQRSKEKGFRIFKIAVLISLLITQFFTFYSEQFKALFWLALNIVLLAVVDYTLDQEEKAAPQVSFNEKK